MWSKFHIYALEDVIWITFDEDEAFVVLTLGGKIDTGWGGVWQGLFSWVQAMIAVWEHLPGSAYNS